MELNLRIGRLTLTNPIGVASGTFGYGTEYESLIDFNHIGALYTKAVTVLPRPGNDIPRIVETPSGILNSIGLANVGVDAFLAEKMVYLASIPSAVIVNVAGSEETEYLHVVEKLESDKRIAGYEINISCPNVKHGGMALGTDPLCVESLTRQLRMLTKKPLIVKLTPNVTDITAIARAAEQGGADAVSCINTLVGMVIDTKNKKPVLAAKTGGLSGPAIRPVGVAMTYKVSRAVSIPVIGMGGILTADDAIQYLLAGASAIQVGTGNFIDPSCISAIHSGIIEYCTKEKVTCIRDLHQFLA